MLYRYNIYLYISPRNHPIFLRFQHCSVQTLFTSKTSDMSRVSLSSSSPNRLKPSFTLPHACLTPLFTFSHVFLNQLLILWATAWLKYLMALTEQYALFCHKKRLVSNKLCHFSPLDCCHVHKYKPPLDQAAAHCPWRLSSLVQPVCWTRVLQHPKHSLLHSTLPEGHGICSFARVTVR